MAGKAGMCAVLKRLPLLVCVASKVSHVCISLNGCLSSPESATSILRRRNPSPTRGNPRSNPQFTPHLTCVQPVQPLLPLLFKLSHEFFLPRPRLARAAKNFAGKLEKFRIEQTDHPVTPGSVPKKIIWQIHQREFQRGNSGSRTGGVYLATSRTIGFGHSRNSTAA